MTAKAKLKEANTYLDLILGEKNDLEKLRHYVSGFLSAIQSIPNHMLQEANDQLGVGIKDSEILYFKDFKKIAKKQENQKAIDFAEWYDISIKTINYPPLDILKDSRDKNIHRKDIVFHFALKSTPKNILEYERPTKMVLEKTGKYKNFDTLDEVMDATDFARREQLKQINAERKKHGDTLETELETELIVGFPNIFGVTLQKFCETVMKVMTMIESAFSNYKKNNHW